MAQSEFKTLLTSSLFTLLGIGVGALGKGVADYRLEKQKFNSALVMKALEPAEPVVRLQTLRLLTATRLLDDDEIRRAVEAYTDSNATTPGSIPQVMAAAAPAPAALPPPADSRVYLLTGLAAKLAALDSLREALVKAGFNIQGERVLIDPGRPITAEVRCFYATDQPQAQRLAAYMQQRLRQPVPVTEWPDKKVRPGYLEIWTGK